MTTVNFKNMVIVLAIGLVTVSCGSRGNAAQGQSATPQTPETKSEQDAPAKGGVYKIADDKFDGEAASLPAVLKNGIGTLNEATVDGSKVELKFKSVERSDFEALVNFYKSNGGTVETAESSYNKLQFSWGTLEVSFFGFDEEASVTAILK